MMSAQFQEGGGQDLFRLKSKTIKMYDPMRVLSHRVGGTQITLILSTNVDKKNRRLATNGNRKH